MWSVYSIAPSSPGQSQATRSLESVWHSDESVLSLCSPRPVSHINHTAVDSICNFSPLTRRLDKIIIYEEFLRLTQNGTQLQNFTLDRSSVLVDGKTSWALELEQGLHIPYLEPQRILSHRPEAALKFLRCVLGSKVPPDFLGLRGF